MANRNAFKFKFKGATVNSATAGNKLCAVSAFSNLIYTVIISTVLLQGLKDSGPHARKLDAYMPHHYVMSLVFLAGASCSLRPICCPPGCASLRTRCGRGASCSGSWPSCTAATAGWRWIPSPRI